MTAVAALPLDGGLDLRALGVRPLDDEEMVSILGGAIPWATVAVFVVAGGVACAIGVAVGIGYYWATHD